jgi:glycosyltransferase involved in cell wall biosynthesis
MLLDARKTLRRAWWLMKAPRARGHVPRPGDPFVVVGMFTTASGIGEAARLEYQAIKRENPNTFAFNLSPALKQEDMAPEIDLIDALPGSERGTLLFVINAPNLPFAMMVCGAALRPGWRRIGLWVWELEVAPRGWERCFPLIDELWFPSEFAARPFRVAGAPPISVRPHRAVVSETVSARRGKFGLPANCFVALTFADAMSSFNRKNPLGAIDAFKSALGGRTDARLIVKIRNAERSPRHHAQLQSAADGVGNIKFTDWILTTKEKLELIASCDVLVSLHRSEGFGLTLAEAQELHVPVVATGWSANTEFLRDGDGAMVPARMIPVDDPGGPYARYSNAVWADPDLKAAAAALSTMHAQWKSAHLAGQLVK